MNSAMVSLNRFWMSSMLPMFAICKSSRIFSRRAFSSGLRFLLAMCNTSCLLLLFYNSQQVYTNYGIVSSSHLGKHRWVVERTFAWFHRYRRLLVRYERRADIHLAFFSLAAALIAFRFC